MLGAWIKKRRKAFGWQIEEDDDENSHLWLSSILLMRIHDTSCMFLLRYIVLHSILHINCDPLFTKSLKFDLNFRRVLL